MSYYENDGFRLGDRSEGLPKRHFGFGEAGARLMQDSHLDENSAAIAERDSANTQNIRGSDFVDVIDKPFVGTIRGVVFDGDYVGGVLGLEGATVTVEGEGIERTFETHSNGEFVFGRLLPGEYDLTVEAPGKVTQTETGIVLEPGDEESFGFALVE